MIGFAKKIGMTRLFIDGKATPVTSIKVAESFVLQKKSADKEGYDAVQVGAFRKRKGNKATVGHSKKHIEAETVFGKISEFKNVDVQDKMKFTSKDFVAGDLISIVAQSRGLGFTGVVKRWGFSGQPASHGHDHERAVGSIGAGGVQRVFPGQKMAGRKGVDTFTLNKQKVVAVDYANNLLFINGSIPGNNSGILKIRKA
jgi:large subunit ribosomal protein L3